MCACHALAAVTLPAILGSHMVLQAGRPVPIWGTAAAGEAVTVSFAGQQQATTADAAGQWRVTLTPLTASAVDAAGQELVVRGTNTVTLSDVVVGEVWLCSGQSNMECSVLSAAKGREECAAAQHPTLRLFHVVNTAAAAPAADVRGQWEVCTPATVGDFSAVGYYFGRDLQQALKVPVGLVQSTWGGSAALGWIPRAELATTPHFAPAVAKVEKEMAADTPAAAEKRQQQFASELARHAQAETAYWIALDALDQGVAEQWAAPAADLKDWGEIREPGIWETAGVPVLAGHDEGVVWFRRAVELPAAWAGHDLVLNLPPLDDSDTAYFNGTQVGRTSGDWTTPRHYPVPAALVQAGSATIAVRVMNAAFAGGFVGDERQLTLSLAGDATAAPLSLSGTWRCRPGTSATTKWPASKWPPMPGHPGLHPAPGAAMNAPGALYYGMLAPLLPLAIRGVVWYQGESDSPNPEAYAELLPLLITTWRAHWGQGDFPFGIVQLPGFGQPPGDSPKDARGWAAIREVQRLTVATVPATGLVTTMDLGERDNIHPFRKQEVGARLTRWALAAAYGQAGEWCGPLLQDARAGGGQVHVRFSHLAGGLSTSDGQPPTRFALAGADGVWHWASAVLAGNEVVVADPAVPTPTQVRYAWADNPEGCNLVNRDGLPAAPFTATLAPLPAAP